MSRAVLAFAPQHTTTKSRVLAIVNRGNGREIDAIATVRRPHEAVAICNMLNARDEGQLMLSGLWASLPSSVRSSLKQARDQLVSDEDERRAFAFDFITEFDELNPPALDSAVNWTALFRVSGCPAEGCDQCDGCPAHAQSRGDQPSVNRCAPEGSCRCLTEELDDCCCGLFDIGPRWAAALYQSLIEIAESLMEHAQDLNWGVEGPAVGFPQSLTAQAPAFYVRLAGACIDLARELAGGRLPVPHTIAELLMLDEAAQSYLEGWTGKEGLELDQIKREWAHLPEAHGDFEMDALWIFQFTGSDWIEIAENEKVYEPDSMDRIFEPLPEAANWPRPIGAAG
ncbi:hypothetical protein [Nocardia lijiangensis]|uniref:hypothetical protein n=1 Tax=Nocardia lijiangensis TaxID=299618 RepID=UPI003D74C7B4